MKDEIMDATTIQDRAVEAILCSGQVIGDGLKELTIVPWGTVKSKKGEFIVDDEAAAAIVAAFAAHAVALPIDFEHESLDAKGRTDACGWIEKLWAVPGIGLKALIKWTDAAREAIQSDSYRYLSPVLLIRRADRRAVELHSAALTNLPAIPGMMQVIASARAQDREVVTMADDTNGQGDLTVLWDKLRAMLGLGDGASMLDTLQAAVAKLGAKDKDDNAGGDKEVAQSVRAMLDLPADAPKSAVVLAMKMRDTSGAAAELVELKARETERLGRERVDAYVLAGKINPHDESTLAAARELALTNPALLDRLMANASRVIPPDGRTTPPPAGFDPSRTLVITCAAGEYRQDARLAKQCSGAAYVNLALREKGMAPLSADEAREYVTV